MSSMCNGRKASGCIGITAIVLSYIDILVTLIFIFLALIASRQESEFVLLGVLKVLDLVLFFFAICNGCVDAGCCDSTNEIPMMPQQYMTSYAKPMEEPQVKYVMVPMNIPPQ